ncbi:EscU/YscU/HrcU family type III secretion system export apparatus switch protein [Legionella spiritensis]|uniref:EscU/YscU/HrcU family type III secretion system export apparatus switch protein n=1 Tax=Legionella spiritensis TaxID=452 RepID=UPI000F6DF800|nr:EscU/YscU/HrcU family type III secretion system export apparatus switch protein [Legionella spiritensis]VEG91292.1 flagellar biosynthesis protein [Legionella spiritensis]
MKKDNPQAIALHYDGKSAPRVTAKGEGAIAEQIIKAAREHGIPLEKDPELTALLAQVKLSDEIPPSLYVAVAQLLAFLYFLNNKKPGDD